MKIKKNCLNASLILFIFGFICVSDLAFSQNAINYDEGMLFKNETSNGNLIGFMAVHFEGITYVNWKVKEEIKDDLFLILRSLDNENFKIIEIKEGVGLKSKLPIFYSFIDKTPPTGTSYYKVLRVYADKTYYKSDTWKVSTEEELSPEDTGHKFFGWKNVEH